MTDSAEPHSVDAEQDESRTSRRLSRWRRILVAVLVVAGCILAPLSVLGVWMHQTLLDTDQYVETVGPLAFIVSLIVALAAWISGPSRIPVHLRAATVGRHRDRVAT